MKFLSFLLALSLSGCAYAMYSPSRVDVKFVGRTQPDQIELFRAAQPTKKFEEIGVVTACCSSDPAHVTTLLRVKAAEKGGDALIGIDVNADGTGMATVIRYL